MSPAPGNWTYSPPNVVPPEPPPAAVVEPMPPAAPAASEGASLGETILTVLGEVAVGVLVVFTLGAYLKRRGCEAQDQSS
jgi:hypothetical protein